MSRTVLFCTQTATVIGGVATWLDQLCDRLPGSGWRPVVGLAHGRHHDAGRYQAAHPRLESLVLDGLAGSREGRVRSICRAAERCGADVIVPLSIADAYEAAARMKLRGSGVRLMVAAHGPSPRMLADAADHRAFIDMAVAVSRLTAHLLEQGAGIAAPRVRYVPNGVASSSTPHQPRAAGEPIRVGYVGRLDEDKRARDLIAFAHELERRGARYRLDVVGSGVHEQEIRAALIAQARDGRVRFHGALERGEIFGSVYPRLDCVVLFSASEGFPLVPVEAMAHGVIPVTSRYRGCATEAIVRDRETGLLFEIGDLRGAVDAVLAIDRDRALADRLSAAARREAAALSLDAMASQWRNALDAAMELPAMCGSALPWPPSPSGRLDRWLSPPVGEGVRRILGRRFRHHGAAEWPFAGPVNADTIGRFEQLIAAFDAHDAPAHSRTMVMPCAG